MRWPWVRRKEYDVLAEKFHRQVELLKERDRALSKLGHANHAERDRLGQLARDLRLLSIHLEAIPPGDRIEARVTIHHEAIYYAYRRDLEFRRLLAYLLEQEFERSESGRSMLMRRPEFS